MHTGMYVYSTTCDTGMDTNRQIHRHSDRQSNIRTDRNTHGAWNKHTYKTQADRNKDGQRLNWEANECSMPLEPHTQTHKHTHTHAEGTGKRTGGEQARVLACASCTRSMSTCVYTYGRHTSACACMFQYKYLTSPSESGPCLYLCKSMSTLWVQGNRRQGPNSKICMFCV